MRLHLFVLLLSAFLATSVEADIVIDNFADGTPLTQVFQGTATQTSSGPGILFGSRDESITVRDFGDDDLIGSLSYGGNLEITQGTHDQTFGFLTYDDFTAFDLTEGGINTRFGLGILANDLDAPLPNVLSLTVVSGVNSSTQTLSIPPSSALPQNVYVDFADFTGVDFTVLDSISLSFDLLGHPGRDIEISFLNATAVPEPSTSTLCLLIFGANSFLVRRRKNS